MTESRAPFEGQRPRSQSHPKQEPVDQDENKFLFSLPLWSEQGRSALEHVVAAAIDGHIAKLSVVDEQALSTLSRDLAPTLVSLTVAHLHAELFVMCSERACECTSQHVFRYVKHQPALIHRLTDVIRYWAAGLVYGYDISVEAGAMAVLLVETALSEIEHEALDNAVAYSPQIALTLQYVEAYLRLQARTMTDFGEEGCLQIATGCLSLIGQIFHDDAEEE